MVGISPPQATATRSLGKPQIIGTRAATPKQNSYYGGLYGYTRNEGRFRSVNSGVPVKDLQLGFSGFYISPNLAGEGIIGNDYSALGALEKLTPSTYQPCYANGQKTINVPNGSPLVLTEPIGFELGAYEVFEVRSGFFVGSSGNNAYFPISGQFNYTNGDSGFVTSNLTTTTEVYGTGTMGVPSGGVQYSEANPTLILGVPATPIVSILLHGNSIPDGFAPSGYSTPLDAYGNAGYFQQGLYFNGSPLNWAAQTCPSDFLSYNTDAAAPRKRAIWKYCTHMIWDNSTNDIGSGNYTLAQMQANFNTFAQAVKDTVGPYGKPLKFYATLTIPHTNSTDNWATAANQTPYTNYATGGLRDQWNSWLTAQAGNGLVDGIINPNVYLEDPNNHGCWISNGTAHAYTPDGTHPTQAACLLALQAVSFVAAGFTP